jgi:hypothetical protein
VQMTKEGMNLPLLLGSVEEAIDWQRGMFHFAGTDLRSAMRELGRRYGKIVVYNDDVQGVGINIDLSRNTPWDQALKAVRDMEEKYASFSEKGDSVRIYASRRVRPGQ